MSGAVTIFIWVLLTAVLGLAGLMSYFFLYEYLRKNTWGPRILDSVFLEVTVPKETSDASKDAAREEKDVIAVAEQFFSTIAHSEHRADLRNFLDINEYISLEIAATGKKIS